jgi:signal transduction histidine kinase
VLELVLETIAVETGALFGHAWASGTSGRWTLVASWRSGGAVSTDPAEPLLARESSMTGEPLVAPDLASLPGPRAILAAEGARSGMAIPIRSGGEVLAGIEIFFASEAALSAAGVERLQQVGDRIGGFLRRRGRRPHDVVSIVSHDLRNPLGVVMMNAELLARKAEVDPERVKRRGELIRRAAERMHRLVNDLLDQCRIDAGTFHVNLAEQPIDRILAEAAEQAQDLAATKEIGILVRAVPGRMRCDRDRIHQVLGNLLGNAIKFTPDSGHIELSAQIEGARVLMRVRDDGPGISQDELPHLFEPFWKGRSGRSRSEGAGLGLSIARAIVESHGGQIWVESTPERGSTFCFAIPGS